MKNVEGKPTPWRRSIPLKLAVLAVVASLGGLLYWLYGDQLRLSHLAEREADLRAALANHPVVFYAAAFVVYVVVTGLSIPGAAVLTLTYGWLFGFWPALVLVSFASTTGATAAFLLSRFLFGETIQRRYGDRLGAFNRALEKEGPFFLFTLRLVPAVPFFVINLLMGLTPIRARTFWWVSQLGMFPGTCVFVFAGSSVPSAKELVAKGAGGILTPQLILAFVILGVFPLIVRHGLRLFGRRPAPLESEAGQAPPDSPSES
ncbi:MAG: TVP38/TMEM64 family protein [Pirellulaceae bacterium]